MSARDEIEAMLLRREEVMAAGDLDALMEFYTVDYEIMAQTLPVVSGRENVREMFKTMFRESTLRPRLVVQDLRVEGTLAVMFARELLTLRELHDGSERHVAMRHMASLSYEDGRWRFSRSMLTRQGAGIAEDCE